jgi:hypothetical protein
MESQLTKFTVVKNNMEIFMTLIVFWNDSTNRRVRRMNKVQKEKRTKGKNNKAPAASNVEPNFCFLFFVFLFLLFDTGQNIQGFMLKYHRWETS